MDKQQLLKDLKQLKQRLTSDVSMAFYEKGRDYGYERVGAWFNKTSSFFAEHMPREVNELGRIGKDCMTVRCGQIESDYDYFRRVYFNRLDAFMESRINDVKNDDYDFTPIQKKVKQVEAATPEAKSKKVFIVHGHDGHVKERTARFIEKLGFEAIILHEQVNKSRTIIEKIEDYSDVTDFAIVLYTPDDLGVIKTNADSLQPRARQNVIFEHGFLMGKLGRENVVPLVEGDIELPNDISGIVYVSENWEMKIAQEMQEAGYDVDFNKLLKK
ncbi:nucleotide-binding protein [Shewanella vaxholmensis]|uniref:nucleotide-binding protein n=1 Tax=Shewanella vaxholmensis TaxID=3063535 RepID=UPI003192E716